jgi:hypothetical protein
LDPVTISLIAAGIGGIGGYLSNSAAQDAIAKQRQVINKLSGQAKIDAQTKLDIAQKALDTRVAQSGGQQSLDKLQELISGYEGMDVTVKPEDFVYGKDVKEFFDPAAEFRQKQAAKATQESLAGQSNLYSGGAGRQLQAEGQELASEEWGKSYERMTADKNSAYQQYRDKIQLAQANLQNVLGKQTGMIDIYGQKKKDIYGAQDLNTQQQLDINEQLSQNLMNLGLSKAQIEAAAAGNSTLGAIIQGATGGAIAGSNVYSAFKGK